MPIELNATRCEAMDAALPAIAKFKRAFGRDVSADFLAELYVARKLGLRLPDRSNEPGADAIGVDGKRFEIKYRSVSTQNVDVNNFDFDYLVLVNLDNDYGLLGMWQLPVEKATAIFTFREKFRKHQATQVAVKRSALKIA